LINGRLYMLKRFFVIVLSVSLWLNANFAHGYEAADMKDGATVKGRVKFSGSAPPDETIAIDRDVQHCGREQKLNKYIIADSMVKNAVVFIDKPQRGKHIPANTAVDLTINKCRVEPHVSVGFVGGNFRFKNNDSILHTLQMKLWLEYQRKVSDRPLKDGATIYNIAFPKKGRVIEKPIKSSHRYQHDTGMIRVTSNAHPWMRGYVFVFDHPYAAVTDDKGSFTMDNLPPGEYVMKIWHESLGMQEKKIKVSSGEVLEVDIEFSK
jgi:hypothetical protein